MITTRSGIETQRKSVKGFSKVSAIIIASLISTFFAAVVYVLITSLSYHA